LPGGEGSESCSSKQAERREERMRNRLAAEGPREGWKGGERERRKEGLRSTPSEANFGFYEVKLYTMGSSPTLAIAKRWISYQFFVENTPF
jgi:hypothetical protein